MSTMFLYLGAAFHVGLFVFHLFFWKLFRWNSALRSLDPINQRVMPVMNLCLMALFLGVAYLSLFQADALLGSELGHLLLFLIALLWVFRAGLQVVYFGLRAPASLGLFLVFLMGAALYGMTWLLVR